MTEFALGRVGGILRNVKVPMRDGVQLATTIYLPPGNGPFPVVLVRSAYNRVGIYDSFFLEHGMALVTQDCRGRYGSEGELVPLLHEPEDGFDTLEWIGRQPWCNGAIGMFGDSYLGATQLLAAPMGSRFLKALNPRFVPGDWWKCAFYHNGVFSLALTWSWLCFETSARIAEANLMPLFDVPKLLRTLPLLSLDEACGAGVVPHYREYVKRSAYDSHWKTINSRCCLDRFDVPVFITGGWYDYYPSETVANFLGLRQHAPTPKLRDSHRMLIGPWTHGISGTSVLGELDFGPDVNRENDSTNRWLDCIFHGRDASEFQKAPIRIFVMGLNHWRDEYEWPLKRTRFVEYYLHERGVLDPQLPSGEEKPDHYTYDPADPVPTLGGNHSVGPYNPGLYEFCRPGPFDQRPIESRSDVLIYSTDVLECDTEVTGPIVLHLYAASSALDTDFVVKLTDVYPDGRSMNITEGVIRARFREDLWGQPKLLEPNKVYRFAIDLQVTSNVFKKGHRIRVLLTSSNFPLWDRNLNTGHDPGTDTEMRVANQIVYHDKLRPSHIVLPIIGE